MYVHGYTLKTNQRFFFSSLMAIETVQKHLIFELKKLVSFFFGEIWLVKKNAGLMEVVEL